ncbi:MAG: hypothetical protein KC493_06190 [Bacteriovoracaceae bacterium]|nr:hypothetical protein [Bacteriovoracaceae bacterium]
MKALSLVLVMFTTTVIAGVTDVDFMPEAGNLHLKSNLEFGNKKLTRTMITPSIKIEEFERSTIVQSNSLTFAIFKNFEVGMEMDITIKDETSISSMTINGATINSGDTTNNYYDAPIKNLGIQDPFIKSRYRIPLPGEGGFNLDIFGAFSFSIGDREVGDSSISTNPIQTNNFEGNAYWGGHRLRLGAGINQDIDQFQWSFNFLTQMNMEREYKDYDALNRTHRVFKIDSYMDFSFQAKLLFEMIDQVHILGQISLNKVGEQTINDTTSNFYNYTLEAQSDIAFGLTAYWNFSENLSVNLGAEFKSISEHDLDHNTNVTYTEKYKDLTQLGYSAGIDFTF